METIQAATKAIERFNKRVRATNVAFNKATAAQRRVMIAKDVLAALRAKQLKAQVGAWLVLPRIEYNSNLRSDEETQRLRDEREEMQLQAALPAIESCRVCALGSLVACKALRKDKLTVGDTPDYGGDLLGEIVAYLRGTFSASQLRMMEYAFEDGGGAVSEGTRALHIWVRRYEGDSADERLKRIMRNVIRNNGTFKP